MMDTAQHNEYRKIIAEKNRQIAELKKKVAEYEETIQCLKDLGLLSSKSRKSGVKEWRAGNAYDKRTPDGARLSEAQSTAPAPKLSEVDQRVVDETLARCRELLDTEEGRAKLRELVEQSKKYAEKLKRDSRVDPATLREPMDF